MREMKMANALYATMNFQTTLWSILDKDILTEEDREYLRTVLYKCRKPKKSFCYEKKTGRKIEFEQCDGKLPKGCVRTYREIDQNIYYKGTYQGKTMKKPRKEWCVILGWNKNTINHYMKRFGSFQAILDNMESLKKEYDERQMYKEDRKRFLGMKDEIYEMYKVHGAEYVMNTLGIS